MAASPAHDGAGPSRDSVAGLSDAQITSISGAVSGFAATFAKQPIQRMKWIRQVDAGPSVPYSTILRRTLQSDGITGLFRGSFAGIMRNVPHSALVYTIYPQWEAAVHQAQQQSAAAAGGGGGGGGGEGGGASSGSGGAVGFSTRFWAGYGTLMSATLVTHPLDTLRVRISILEGEAGRTSTANVVRNMMAQGGLRNFYQGYGATLLGAGPRGALGFGVFETLKDLSAEDHIDRMLPSNPTVRKLLFGYVAGLTAETAIYPIDTVRRRQQALGESTPMGRNNVFQALLILGRQEGVGGMFKGLSLNLFKNPVATAVSFAINDLVKDLMGHSAHRDTPERSSTC